MILTFSSSDGIFSAYFFSLFMMLASKTRLFDFISREGCLNKKSLLLLESFFGGKISWASVHGCGSVQMSLVLSSLLTGHSLIKCHRESVACEWRWSRDFS
jgi:hypothetical protein